MRWDKAIGDTGFAILPARFSHEYLDQLLRQIGQLAPRRSRAGVRHAMGLSPVADLARHPQMIELARDILGPHTFPFRATLFNKSPAANWLVVWRQDTALPLRGRTESEGWGPWSVKEGIAYAHAPAAALSQVLALRLSLDDSTVENGPLRILPETHMLGVLSDDSIHELAAKVAPVTVAPASCRLSRGRLALAVAARRHHSRRDGDTTCSLIIHAC